MDFKGIKKKNDTHIYKYQGTHCDKCENHDDCTKLKFRSIKFDTREEYQTKMREKLDSDKGREIYMKRQGIVEPVHGDDQKNRGWIQHHLRGYFKAKAEFILVRIALNSTNIPLSNLLKSSIVSNSFTKFISFKLILNLENNDDGV